ncbi:hypothetical protein RI138_00980 [Streptomyces sp. C11-1]|uniref:Integral membrane protein n=1 Tax=Streptomyces durocortorensis TaxID=2811104 RepID=A0ABY9VNK7_9ACTN|nr:hypothetical protein [Streptomyces durocortorensis]WNF25490.1 hypothetical protein RI138_00980 [Streptomyces durocortorensis]
MRTDLKIVWDVPATPPGLAGRVERFMGPGKSRSESAVEIAGIVGCGLLLAVGVWASGVWHELSGVQLVVVGLAGLDLIGGVLTNATNAAKRWYHRRASGARRARLLFVAAHLIHLMAMGFVVLSGDWRWTLANAALLLAGAAIVEFTPLHLKRPVSMAALMAAVLVNLFWLEVPASLGWFAPLFFLKLLVCHLVPEAPLERRHHA